VQFTVLIVDDEKNIRSGLSKALEAEGYRALTAEDGAEGWNLINSEDVDVVIADLKMPRLSGEELLKRVSSSYPTLPVIILTGHGTIESAVSAMRDGAVDFVTKPVNLERLSLLVKRAISNRELYLRHTALKEEMDQLKKKQKFSKIIGRSSKMKQVMEVVEQAADTKASVLITGESGVGKELIADALHDLSSRAEKPYIKVHCASLSESLLESELFGHEKGSFTGASARKRGRFELADKGTIFLDEIGEISQQVQVKILRVLQERSFERVGGEETLSVDVRVISATNKELKEEIKRGMFREDLYYRLNVVHIHVPPLRERREDIPLLTTAFIKEFSEENGKQIQGISHKASSLVYSYSWPGNIRELRNCMESAVVLCRGDVIEVEDLPLTVREGSEEETVYIPVGTSLEEAQRKIIQATLNYCGGNKSKTADILDIGRKTLHRKLQDYAID